MKNLEFALNQYKTVGYRRIMLSFLSLLFAVVFYKVALHARDYIRTPEYFSSNDFVSSSITTLIMGIVVIVTALLVVYASVTVVATLVKLPSLLLSKQKTCFNLSEEGITVKTPFDFMRRKYFLGKDEGCIIYGSLSRETDYIRLTLGIPYNQGLFGVKKLVIRDYPFYITKDAAKTFIDYAKEKGISVRKYSLNELV